MTQVGGPAAINGFLYQMLHHLGWMVGVSLTGTIAGQPGQDALLVLEPSHGGDARAETNSRYLVEQYKTREDGTWSINAIVEVLQDLRKAVPPSRPSNALYRFVTDGRAGRLNPLESFLADARVAKTATDLDDVKARKFGNELLLTNRRFFDHVVASTRSNQSSAEKDEQATVLHLLAAFEMEFNSDSNHQAAAVERLLRNYAPNLGDERAIRERLVGRLMQTLSRGECQLKAADIHSMLREVGLSPERMKRLATLGDAMNMMVQRRSQRLRYRSEYDVRGAPDWPADKHVLIITGESGAGKSWQLGRLLEELGRGDVPATLITSGHQLGEILAQAARDLWQRGLNETSDQTIGGLSNFLRELAPNASWQFTIGVDDLQDIDLARALVRQDWEDWRMRLVFTAPPAIAQALTLSEGDRVCVRQIGEFTVDELATLLTSRDRSWGELPSDLKRLLRNPILAGVYLDLDHASFKSAPGSEYEIFEAFWKRIAVRARPGDEGVVLAFADRILDNGSYPISRSQWASIGLNDDILARLDAAGWLRSVAAGDVAFAHDRLLNWGVAKAIARRFERHELTSDTLASLLAHETLNLAGVVGRRLGYVMMDTLWLLAERLEHAGSIASIIRSMERSNGFRTSSETLYESLLPTLGARSIPVLEQLLHQPLDDRGQYRLRLLGKTLSNIAGQEGVNLDQLVRDSLTHPSRDNQGVALRILTAAPNSDHVNRVWEIHQLDVAALEDGTAALGIDYYFESMAALRSAVAKWPEWLREKIQHADAATESIPTLGYLLHGLEHADAAGIWSVSSETLLEKIPANRPRSLLSCIARFKDRSRTAYVIEQLSQPEDAAAGTALFALSILDPAGALQRLVEVPEWDRYLHRNSWLPTLLQLLPDQTRARALEMARSAPANSRVIESLFGQRADDIDSALLQFVLRKLDTDLRTYISNGKLNEPLWADEPFRFLGTLTRPDLLRELRAEAGQPLEHAITELASDRLTSDDRSHDHFLESARRVLTLMAGQGITTLLQRELSSQHYWVRHRGLKWAFVRNDPCIVARLAAIAGQPVPLNANGQPEPRALSEHYDSLIALAGLGADQAIATVLQGDTSASVPLALADLRAHQGVMPQALTNDALQTLASPEVAEEASLRALVVLWCSSDKAAIPVVRAVLERVEPESEQALYACRALAELGDDSQEFFRLLVRLVPTKKNGELALRLMPRFEDRGLNEMARWLRDAASGSDRLLAETVIRELFRHSKTRTLAISEAAQRSARGRLFTSRLYEIAAEANDPAIRDHILDKAFISRSFEVSEPLHAIKGLAKFDAVRAMEAIALGLVNHPKIEKGLCLLLVEIAPIDAPNKLISLAIQIDRVSLHNAVGQALRRVDRDKATPALIAAMHGSVLERKAAARIAAWLPCPAIAGALDALATTDSANEVRTTVLAAQKAHRQEGHVRELMASFAEASPDERWGLLLAILRGGDAHLLADAKDDLWIGHAITPSMPEIYWHFVEEELRAELNKL